eukprot:4384474-Prymnesium_polylepis.1
MHAALAIDPYAALGHSRQVKLRDVRLVARRDRRRRCDRPAVSDDRRAPRDLGGRPLVHVAALHDHEQVGTRLQQRHILGHVATHQQHVRQVATRKASHRQPHQLAANRGRCAQRLER